MNGAQIAMIVLFAIGVGISAAKNGQPQTGKHNILATLFAQSIVAAILYWGGFWSAA